MNAHVNGMEPAQLVPMLGGKYLLFRLMGEEFGVEITRVQEIIGISPITAIPMSPHYMNGVINLRGSIIPVLDLRARLGMDRVEYTDRSCIIVLEIMYVERHRKVGVIVDEVAEVLDVSNPSIQAAPDFGNVLDTGMMVGLGVVEERVIQLLDVDRLASPAIMSQAPSLTNDLEQDGAPA